MKNILLTIIILVIIVLLVWFFGRNASEDNLVNNSSMLRSDSELPIIEEVPEYYSNAEGFYVRPEGDQSYPGVVMIHEWWGLNDNIKDMARELAKNGYQVLAVDLFGGVATTTDEARAQVSGLDQSVALENLKGATEYLRERGASKIASLGWCFGGGQSLQLSLSDVDLDGTIIYYGQIETDEAKLSSIEWPVLGIFGDNDMSIPTSTVRTFESNLSSVGVKNDIYIYPGVGHAFANPSGMNYAPTETRDAWSKTLSFLNENLK